MGISPQKKAAIHREYVTTDISVRALAKKHDIGKSTIAKWMQAEAWSAEKKAYLLKAAKKAQEEARRDKVAWEQSMEQYVDALAQRTEAIYKSADLLLKKVNELLQLEDALAPRDLKSLSSTLLDVKMIHDVKAPDESRGNNSYSVEFVHRDWEDADSDAETTTDISN